MKRALAHTKLWLFILLLITLSLPAQALTPQDAIAVVKPAVVMVEAAGLWGSGFFVSSDGYLLTSYRVVDSSPQVTVIYQNCERLTGAVVASDPRLDLALVRVQDSRAFPTVTLGDSSQFQEGTTLALTGYPSPQLLVQDFAGSLSATTSRTMVGTVLPSRLQLDSSGSVSSGAPVYSLDTGEVVAIAQAGSTAGGLGLPINEAKLFLQRAALVLKANPTNDPVAPGNISLLHLIGADGTLTGTFVSSASCLTIPQSHESFYEQTYSNAGYTSCFGRLAPAISEPLPLGKGFIFTSNDGRLRAYNPGPTGALRTISTVATESSFFPASGDGTRVCFAAGTPIFSSKKKVDAGTCLRSVISLASGSLSVATTKVVPVVDGRGTIYGMNPTGTIDWQYQSGFVGSPVVSGDRVYFGGMGVYGVLDAATGKELWVHRESLGATHAKWYSVTVGGGVLLVATSPVVVKFTPEFPGYMVLGDGPLTLTAISLANNKMLWNANVSDLTGQTYPMAVGLTVDSANAMIYLTRAGQTFAFSNQGKPAWTFGKPLQEADKAKEADQLTRLSTTITCDGDALYLGGDDNKIYCLNSRTGRLCWSFTGRAAMAEPALSDNTLYCGSADGWLYALDPATGTLKWKIAVDSLPTGRPVVHNGQLYFTSQDTASSVGQINAVYLPK